MSTYQLPPLKNEKQFEDFMTDLFNEIHNTNTYQNIDYQTFGVKGQKQKGIDIYSAHTRTVIQCKVKDVKKREDIIRKELMIDIINDLEKANGLTFDFDRFIFVSTFRDDGLLQEFTSQQAKEKKIAYSLQYWGWDTISKYAEQYEVILKKYFPKFIPKAIKPSKKTIVELPEGALGRDLSKKNYVVYLGKRYGDWKQLQFDQEGKGEKFNWASHNKSLMNRYHAAGINYIPVECFDDIVAYLSLKIDKTIFGRNQKAKGRRNYSTYEEHLKGIDDIK